MAAEQVMLTQDDKKWDRVWTTDEIRKNSANWTLAGDVGLYNLLNEISQHIISRTHEVQNAVDSLVYNTKTASVKVNNVINDFHMLSNVQFVENRVYDEEVQEPVSDTKPAEKSKEQREAEMLPKLVKALELGMSVLDKAFNKINVNDVSDSEDEDLSSEGRMILEPKNPYEQRPLPYIIGSGEFMADDYAGLKDLIQEDAESSAETESSTTDSDDSTSSEEDLPLDDDKFSATPVSRREVQSISNHYSSSEESELFGVEKEDNGFISDSSLEVKSKEEIVPKSNGDIKTEVRDIRQSSVSSMQSRLNLPQVLPTSNPTQKKKESEDLFANNDDYSDEDSPFRKKSGLFTSDAHFDQEKDLFEDDLFGNKKKDTTKPSNSLKPPSAQKSPSAIQKKKEPDLFGDDDDSDDDIFNRLKKSSIPKEALVPKQDSPDKADSSSSPSSAPSIKASGNAFDFVTGSGNVDTLFGDESDGDDLFSSKNTVSKKLNFNHDDDADDLFGLTKKNKSIKTETQKENNKKGEKSSLFEANSSEEKSYKKLGMPLPGLVSKKSKEALFGDSDSDEKGEKITNIIPAAPPPKQKKEISIFDDDDEEDDIFSQKPKLFSPGKSPSVKNKPEDSVLEKSIKEEDKKEVSSKPMKTAPSLFEDFNDEDKSDIFLANSEKAETSLFDESDGFDLFKSKKLEKPVISKSIPTPVQEKKSEDNDKSLFETISHKEKVSSSASKPLLFSTTVKVNNSPEASSSKAEVLDDNQFGFDTPADSSKTLNVLSKDRAKITSKRRKPTRRGRLAALESNEGIKEQSIPTMSTPKSNTLDSSDDLFLVKESETPTVTSHKSQEKKKMDRMSQLMSEAASSKVGKKSTPRVEPEEEVVDIFAEIGGKRDATSQSFSFKSPIESSIKSSFLDEKNETSEVSSVLGAENGDDEFFTEPSFKNFSNSISKKESFLDLDDDEDDLFSIKPSSSLKKKVDTPEDDIFADDSDIFADLQREKYEMFPSQLYDGDDDEDIFSNMGQSLVNSEKPLSVSATAKKEIEKKLVKEVEKKPAFEDPLSGLLGDN